MDRKVVARFIATGLTAAILGGCGIVPRVAQQTTAAALAPFTTAANAAATNMQVLGRGMQYMTQQTTQTTRQITALNNTARAYQPRPVAYQQPARTPRANRPSSRNREADGAERKDPPLDVLPQHVLKRLTEDQAGLQHAAQNVATTAAVGETIFWKQDGREGTATTESENVMGSFTCRTFSQTIALEDYFDTASLTACRNPGGAWITSF
jgi:hypothetical protein